MDPVTHTLVGAVLANGVFRRRLGNASIPILAVASNLPDIDALVMLSGRPEALLLRRTFGHSLCLLPLWILLMAWICRRLCPRLGFGACLALTAVGASLHLVFDMVNSFGVVLLWPFSLWRPEWAIIYIVDPLLTGLLAAPFLVCAPARLRSVLPRLCKGSLVAVACYMTLCAASRASADRVLARQVAELPARPDFVYLFPEPLGAHRWRGVIRSGDTYRLYLISSLGGTCDLKGLIRSAIDDPRVIAAGQSELGLRLNQFFKAPVWRVHGAEAESPVTVEDLRFASLVLNRDAIFVFTLPAEPALSR
ncbi:MAG TPA: metal-dependent hydrolase [Candidatus Polarisedimenticolia bacterium]|nr:metal-dependent hydrolase [Candidatus Polarisedimenticolia bacterium]